MSRSGYNDDYDDESFPNASALFHANTKAFYAALEKQIFGDKA